MFLSISFLVVLPLLILGGGGYDYLFHLTWGHNFAAQFWSGDLYPRWLMNMNAGCGGPDLFFYPPLPFYLNSLFYWLDPIAPVGWYPLVASTFVILFLAALACYTWLRTYVKDEVATLGALIYVTMPYVIHNVYTNFSFAENFTLLCFPLLLYTTDKVISGKKNAWIGLALIAAIMGLSNIPGVVRGAATILIYVAVRSDRKKLASVCVELLKAAGLATLLTAFYYLPLIENLNNVHVYGDELLKDSIKERLYLNFDKFSADEFITVMLLTVTEIAVLYLWLSLKGTKDKTIKMIANTMLVLSLFSIFMQFRVSSFVWAFYPFDALIRQPSRFLMFQGLALVILSVCKMHLHSSRLGLEKARWIIASALICLTIPLGAVFISMTRVELVAAPNTAHDKNMQTYFKNGIVVFHEYIPLHTDLKWLVPSSVEKLAAICKKQVIAKNSPTAKTEIVSWQPREIMAKISTPVKSTIQITQFYMPGWKVKESSGGQEYDVRYSDGVGLIEFDVPAGDREIEITLPRSKYEIIGFVLSLLAGLFVIFRRFRI